MHVSPMLTRPCAPRVLRSGDDVYRFDRACREGLPSQLLRATTSLQKATAASRYLSALLSEFLPIDEATAFAAALVESRYAPLAAELQCDLQPPCSPDCCASHTHALELPLLYAGAGPPPSRVWQDD